jgi:uroporphyrinogen-III decarboxylase
MDKMITSKRLVRGAFESADLPRLPFIPWIFTHAARLEQIPVRRIFADPTQYTKCLQNARKLYGYDAIISSFDSSLETEICGYPVNWKGDYEAPATTPHPEFDFGRLKDINIESTSKTGRFGTVIESLRRINRVSGPNLALAAVVTGPLTLTAGLIGRDPLKDFTERPEEVIQAIEAAAGFLLKVVQIYCQLELDIIAIADRLMPVFPAAHLSWLQSTFSPIVNMVRFYNAFSVLLPGESSSDNLANLVDLGFDGIVTAGIDLNTWNKLKGGRSCVLGKAIPSHLLTSEPKELQAYLETQLPERIEPGVFLTTDWEVPPDTPPDNVHLVMNMISKD